MKKFLKQYKAAYSGLPKTAWLLSIIILINRTGSIVFFFMTLYLTTQKDFSVSEAGQMISIYGLGALIGALLGGWLTDKIGALWVQKASLFLSGIGYIVLGYEDNVWGIGMLLFLIAVVSEAFRPANATAMAAVCPPEIRSRGFALNRLAVNLGVTIGPAIGGFLATINYLYLFWIDGMTCIIAAVLLWTFFRRIKIDTQMTGLNDVEIIKSPYKDKIFLFVLMLLLIMGIGFVQVFNTWPLYLKNAYHLLENQIGLLLALNAFMVATIEMPLVYILEQKNVIKIMGFGGLLLLLGFGLLPLFHNYLYAIFTVIIWTSGEILVFPFMGGFIANRSTDRNRGKYMGMFTFTFSLALVIGPIFGTWVYDIYSPESLWYGIGLVGIFIWFGFVLIYTLLKLERNKARSVQ